jgi:hypothetical protein
MYPIIKMGYRRQICDLLSIMIGYSGVRTPQFVWIAN